LFSFKNLLNLNLVYVFNNLLFDYRFILITKSQQSLISLSLFRQSAVWLERECQDFFNLYFLYLEDSRKLLLDYTNNFKLVDNTSNLPTYNSNYYELF